MDQSRRSPGTALRSRQAARPLTRPAADPLDLAFDTPVAPIHVRRPAAPHRTTPRVTRPAARPPIKPARGVGGLGMTAVCVAFLAIGFAAGFAAQGLISKRSIDADLTSPRSTVASANFSF